MIKNIFLTHNKI